jgi:hypothetical protein
MIWWFFGSLVVGYCGLVRFDTWYERRRSKVEDCEERPGGSCMTVSM